MSSTARGFCVVEYFHNGDQLLCIISGSWLTGDKKHAYLSPAKGSLFLRAVRNHATVDSGIEPTPIEIHATCNTYKRAKHVEQSITDDTFPSSDGTMPLGVPGKRKRWPVQFSTSEEDSGDYCAKKAPNSHDRSFAYVCQPKTSTSKAPAQQRSITPTTCEQGGDRIDKILEILQRLVNMMQTFSVSIQEVDRKIDIMKNNISAALAKGYGESHFTLTTLKELHHVEVICRSKETREELMNISITTDEDTASKFVRNLMIRLLRTSILLEVNYSGAKGKLAFRKTSLNDFVTNEALKRVTDGALTVKDVAASIRSWMHDKGRRSVSCSGVPHVPESTVLQHSFDEIDLDEN